LISRCPLSLSLSLPLSSCLSFSFLFLPFFSFVILGATHSLAQWNLPHIGQVTLPAFRSSYALFPLKYVRARMRTRVVIFTDRWRTTCRSIRKNLQKHRNFLFREEYSFPFQNQLCAYADPDRAPNETDQGWIYRIADVMSSSTLF